MSKPVSIILLAVLALGAGALLYVVAFNDPAPNQGNAANTPEVENRPFDKEGFFRDFDVDGNHIITFAEFDGVYSKWGADRRFSHGPGQPGLDSKAAFDFFDRNDDGEIDKDDILYAWDQAWEQFSADTMKRGLTPRDWKGKFLALNQQQVEAFNREKGAVARGEVPFGGAFFDSKYLMTGRYGRVTKPDGQAVEGVLSERDGRLWVVTGEAKLLVFKPDAVTVVEDPKAHALEYLKLVKDTPFDAVEANLKLAKSCDEWGLKREAGALYARVLIFDRANETAMQALGLKLAGDKYLPREG